MSGCVIGLFPNQTNGLHDPVIGTQAYPRLAMAWISLIIVIRSYKRMFPSRWMGAVLICSFCFSPADSQAQTVPAANSGIPLDVLIESARVQNPMLTASRLEAEAMALQSGQVAAWPDPQLSFVYQPFPIYTARGIQRSQVRVEQMVPYPGKLRLKGAIADFQAEGAGFDAKAFEDDVVMQIKQAYYEVHRVDKQRNLIASFEQRLRDFEQSATAQYEVGTGLQQAIIKAQLERNTLSRQLLLLAQQRRSAVETLARLSNQSIPDAMQTAVPEALPDVSGLELKGLYTHALVVRPELDRLSSAMAQNDAEKALAEKAFLPDFGFSITYFDVGTADIPPAADGRDALALGISIKVPLQRKSRRARVEEIDVRFRQIAARQEALETGIQTSLADLLSGLHLEAEQIILFRDVLIPQAQTTLESTLSAYTTGRIGFLDLLDAERMLFNLHTGYEDARARYLKTIAALERTLGIENIAPYLKKP